MPAIRKVPGTRLEWATFPEWVHLVMTVGNTHRCCRSTYDRCARLYASVKVSDIRACTDVAALARAADIFDRGRYNDVPEVGLRRFWRRDVLGFMLVETRNQLERVQSGRAFAPRRAKGPRFDPGRLPDAALDRLIQTHPDLQMVDQLRAERQRRLEAAAAAA